MTLTLALSRTRERETLIAGDSLVRSESNAFLFPRVLPTSNSEPLSPVHLLYKEWRNTQEQERYSHRHHRRQYQPQYYRRGLEVKLAKPVAERAGRRHDADIDGAAVDGVNAENAKDQDRRIEQRIGNTQHVDEDPDQRQVEDQQHQVADIHAGDEAPKKLRLLGDQERPRRDAMDHHRGDHDGGNGPGRNAQGEHGNKGAGGGRVVGRLRAGDPRNRAVTEALRILRKPLLHRVGNERGDDVSRAGNDADYKSE